MEIQPMFMECVAFLCAEHKGRAGGTAFFVEVEEGRKSWTYLVTALHNLHEVQGQEIFVRVNTHPGVSDLGFDDVLTRKDDWFKHDKADVATILSPIDRSKFALQQIPLDLFIDKRCRLDVDILMGRGNPILEPILKATYKEGIPVMVGHDVFSPGLFVQSAGENRNLPIVRFGNVSRMPSDEMIVLETPNSRREIRAYLVETHSWGGFSGSPMFWHYEYNIATPILAVRLGEDWQKPKSPLILDERPKQPQPIPVVVSRGYVMGLLGLVSGHFDIPKKSVGEEIETGINAGIGVVTPAENIRELLMSDEVVEDRNNRAANERMPVAMGDSVLTKRSGTQILEGVRATIPIPTRGQF